MLRPSLLVLAGVAVGCAATAAVHMVSKRARAGSKELEAEDVLMKKALSTPAPRRFATALLTLEMPDTPAGIRANRALIAAAVKRVDRCLYIAFEGSAVSSPADPVDAARPKKGKQAVDTSVLVKAIGHYDDVFEAALACGNVELDCRVLLPVPGMANERTVWLLPSLEAVFGQPSEELLQIVRQLNTGRRELGLGPVAFVSLAAEAGAADFEHHLYFDDICGRLPAFDNVVLGGTFDHMHMGHRKLLTVAVLVCRRRLVVGVTHDSMLTRKANAHLIQTFKDRCRSVHDFVASIDPSLELEVVPIRDMYGPTVSDPSLNAIIVSSETAANAETINTERGRRGMEPMTVVSLARVSAVSSSLIRSVLMPHEH